MPHTRMSSLVSAAIPGFFFLVGIVSGIIGLCGIPRHGRKGLLWPSLIGIFLWVGLIALAVPVFNTVRKNALQAAALRATPTVLRPAKHAPDAKPFQDAELGFSFDIPDGFESFDVSNSPGKFKHGFMKPGTELNSFVLIKSLKLPLAREHLTLDQIPEGSKGKGITVQKFNWRGIDVDAICVPEEINGRPYLTYNVQIPLRKEAIQIGFAGPADTKEAIRACVALVLDSLDGESNW